jgi:3'-5' exoribonuclease
VVVKNKEFIRDLKPGQYFTGPLMVKSLRRLLTKKGAPYLSVEFVDRTGVLSAKAWDEVEAYLTVLAPGEAALVGGPIDAYQGAKQLTVRSASRLDQNSLDLSDFIPTARQSAEELLASLNGVIQGIVDPDYHRLVISVINHPQCQAFGTLPGGKTFHHAYLRGLLEHSVSVAKLALLIGQHYQPYLNQDLLVTGAILHDVGKTWEFTAAPSSEYTTPGRLLGHLQMGAAFIGEVAKTLDNFPADKLLLVQHLLVSHHGEAEYGAIQTPKLLEALALHQIDDLDGKLNGVGVFIREELEAQEPEARTGWTSYHRLLKSYYLHTPGSPLWGEEVSPPVPASEPNPGLAPSPASGLNLKGLEPGFRPPDINETRPPKPNNPPNPRPSNEKFLLEEKRYHQKLF